MEESRDALPADPPDPLEELRAHQLELEVQNLKLREVEVQLRTAADRYRDLYDMAPVAYLALDSQGRILEANLTAGEILGVERGRLQGESLSAFVHSSGQDKYFLEVRARLGTLGRHSCHLRLKDGGDGPTWVRLDLSSDLDEAGETHRSWCTLVDVSGQKMAEEAVRASRDRLKELAGELHRAREEERVRLARELHDNLGQTLIALQMDLHSLGKEVLEKGSDAQRRVEVMKALISQCIESLNMELGDLRPPELDILGLSEAMEYQLARAARASPLEMETDLRVDSASLSPEQKTEIFRIFQEALNNVIRHAHAERLGVSLAQSESALLLELTDDGIGISPTQAEGPRSFGLMGARERAERLGGSIEVHSLPEGGTKFRLEVPLLGLSNLS